jgi:hypothetical protein
MDTLKEMTDITIVNENTISYRDNNLTITKNRDKYSSYVDGKIIKRKQIKTIVKLFKEFVDSEIEYNKERNDEFNRTIELLTNILNIHVDGYKAEHKSKCHSYRITTNKQNINIYSNGVVFKIDNLYLNENQFVEIINILISDADIIKTQKSSHLMHGDINSEQYEKLLDGKIYDTDINIIQLITKDNFFFVEYKFNK